MSDDPLDGADIGETATVTETTDIWVGDLRDDGTRGSDRLVEDRVTDLAIVKDEHGDTMVRVTVESDVTKRLPRRWDTAREPRTDSERRTARRKRWVRRGISGGVAVATLGVFLVVLRQVNRALAGSMSINGEPLPALSIWPVLVVLLLAAAFMHAMQHLPRWVVRP